MPTITLASTPDGVTYAVVPAGPYDGTVTTPVTVTATLSDGLEWGHDAGDVDLVNPTTATYDVTLNAASCDAVTPVAPTVTQAVCRNGALESPTSSCRKPMGSPTRLIPKDPT